MKSSINAGFSPSAQEVTDAERIVTLDRQAAAEGRGSFAVDGKMIDICAAGGGPARTGKRDHGTNPEGARADMTAVTR